MYSVYIFCVIRVGSSAWNDGPYGAGRPGPQQEHAWTGQGVSKVILQQIIYEDFSCFFAQGFESINNLSTAIWRTPVYVQYILNISLLF